MTIKLFFQLFGMFAFSWMMGKFAVFGHSDEDYDWEEIDKQKLTSRTNSEKESMYMDPIQLKEIETVSIILESAYENLRKLHQQSTHKTYTKPSINNTHVQTLTESKVYYQMNSLLEQTYQVLKGQKKMSVEPIVQALYQVREKALEQFGICFTQLGIRVDDYPEIQHLQQVIHSLSDMDRTLTSKM